MTGAAIVFPRSCLIAELEMGGRRSVPRGHPITLKSARLLRTRLSKTIFELKRRLGVTPTRPGS
eukprot:15460798-Alexandrium_andersonii.AAC.1